MKLAIHFCFIIGVLFLTACRKDEVDITITEETDDPKVYYDANITGRVVDDQGKGIAGATISILGKQVISETDGLFSMHQTKVNEKASVLVTEKAGFTTDLKIIQVGYNNVAYVEITLNQTNSPLKLDLTEEKEIIIDNRLTLTVGSDFFEYPDGSNFDGTISLEVIEKSSMEGSHLNGLHIKNSKDQVLLIDGGYQIFDTHHL